MTRLVDHEITSPTSLEEALAFLAAHADEGWQPLAGGTDVLVGINYGKETRSRWLDVSGLRGELAGIGREGERIRIGGLATMTDLRRSELLRTECALIGQAAATIGAVQIQNRATVAGNIVNASPAGDTLPVWLAVDAEVELASAQGTRRVPYREFHTGYRATVRRDNELVTALLLEPISRERTRILFRKVGTRAAQAISKMVFAGVLREDEAGNLKDVRLAFGSMAPIPLRAAAAEAEASGGKRDRATGERVAARLAGDLAPIDDDRSTATYRMAVARNVVREFVAGGLGQARA